MIECTNPDGHVLGQGFNIAHMEEYVWCIKCERKWSKAEITAIINEHPALKRENEAGRQFAIWFSAIWEDEDYRKDGGGRTHAELLDYIMAVFPDALITAEEQDRPDEADLLMMDEMEEMSEEQDNADDECNPQ